jgi:tRNA modification GTPase
MLVFDPICALATPPGAAGLAVIRLSGKDSLAVADRCFRGRIPLAEATGHTIHYGRFFRDGEAIDEVTASVYRAPHSYTGEDVVEFGCHGGRVVSAEIIETLIAAGARHAEAGEFTKRAFLNQKLDLTQVEAVGDLIHAVSRKGSHAAAKQLMGGFTRRLNTLRERLLELCGLVELELDFSQEDIEFINKSALAAKIEETRMFCVELAESFRSAEIVRSGYSVGIVGYPNAGKSSLLNALLERKRAIVSAQPGTTRDYLEETMYVEGTPIRLIDTAGFRESDDTIEVEGIELAKELLAQCHLILILNDISEGALHSDALLQSLRVQFAESEILLAHTKLDLAPPDIALQLRGNEHIGLSTREGTGIQDLKTLLARKAHAATQTVNDALINARQATLLRQAADALEKAQLSVLSGASNEFTALDLRDALKRIGEITGAVWNDDVLNAVFSKFCIGK